MTATPAPTQAGAEAVRVETATEAPAGWADYLATRQEPTLWADARWGAIHQEVYGNRSTYLTARRERRIVGVLPLVLQKGLLFGMHLCSVPWFDSAGLFADDRAAEEALLASAGEVRQQAGAKWVELRQRQPLAVGLPARTDKVTLEFALPADPEELWKALKAKVRNLVRKPQKEGLATVRGGAELLGEFYAIYLRTMRDLGSPPHALRFFQRLCAAFGEQVGVFVTRRDAQPLAAGLTLRDGAVVRLPWAGSDWRFRSTSANMLLYWDMIADACRGGAATFDFGRSTRDGGTYAFKRQWGAEEVPLTWQFLLPPGEQLPELRPDSGKFKLLVACWKKLPLPLARLLGGRLIGKLS